MMRHDTIIIGAGLSGIGMAWHHRVARPDDDLVIIEARSELGGTWDLFRYPGIRSDSDMSTLGYTFRPWLGDKAITDGESIKRYLEETAETQGIIDRIQFNRRLVAADFDRKTHCWTITLEADDGSRHVKQCRFLMLCTGYYNYAQGYTPVLHGIDRFRGEVIHPQHWPETLSLKGKRIVLIGSGATAVTLLPSLCDAGASVTLIQRTPTYIAKAPSQDVWAQRFIRWFGSRIGHWMTRWKNILYTMGIFQLSRRWPSVIRRSIVEDVRASVGDHIDVDRHFSPPYNPWDQRLCIAPDGDFFAALNSGAADIRTDSIREFDEEHVVLESGERIPADIVITATGLEIQVGGDARFSVDGIEVHVAKTITYKGAMLSGMPNLVITVGYTNASWTLKSEMIAQWSVTLVDHMRQHGLTEVMPDAGSQQGSRPLIDLASGYLRRGSDVMPRQSDRRPWQVNQNYFLDLKAFKWSAIDDGDLRFDKLRVQ
ncbi:MAG: flavin-containing monooxygenase [Woeseiaceae bacterium]